MSELRPTSRTKGYFSVVLCGHDPESPAQPKAADSSMRRVRG
jgi:hypothetical protein